MINFYIANCKGSKINKVLKAFQKYDCKVEVKIVINKNPERGLEYFVRHKDTDIVLIDTDTNYPKLNINGIKLAKRMKLINKNTLIVFIAEKDHLQTLIDISKSDPFYYTTTNRVESDLPKIFEKYSDLKHQAKRVFAYSKRGIIYDVYLDDILYFTSYHRTIKFKDINGNIDEFYDKLDNVEESIFNKTKLYVRVGQSYLVNIKYIISVVNDDIHMTDGTIIPISKRYSRIVNFNKNKRPGE